MDEFPLHFKVKFMKNESIEEVIKQFFIRNTFNEKLSYTFEPITPYTQDSVYIEPMYVMKVNTTCVTKLKEGKLYRYFTDLCSKWCSMFDEEIDLPSWLVPVNRTFFNKKVPVHLNVATSGFAFGTLPTMKNFVQHYHYDSRSEKHIELLTFFYHNKKNFTLFLDLNHPHHCANRLKQKIVFHYDTVAKVIIEDLDSTDYIDFYFWLNSPPFVYIEQKRKKDDEFGNGYSKFNDLLWERHWEFGCECKNSLCRISKIGRAPIFKIKLIGKKRSRAIIERLMHRCHTNVEFCYGYIDTTIIPLEHVNKYKKYIDIEDLCMGESQTFNCMYAWQLMFSQSLEVRDQINLKCFHGNEFHRKQWYFLRDCITCQIKKNADAFCSAIFHISEMISKTETFSFSEALEVLFDHYCQTDVTVDDLPHGMCIVRRMIITPSRHVLYPPSESFDNRVIRDIPNAKEFLLRVSIQDDNFSKLTFAIQFHSKKEQFMYNIAGKFLENGLDVGNRVYELLACSNSQLREHSFWCYAEDQSGRTADDIRKFLGNFTPIRNVAKYMSRIGQCFSTSDEAVQISVPAKDQKCIEDIKTPNKKYTFSDGIGKISPCLADEIRTAREALIKYVPEGCSVYKPSAFQIRYKGCKGMLAEVNRNFDNCGSERLLSYRPSMEKFKCPKSNKLEIIKVSAPRSMCLNRPLITILEQLGVPKKVFLDLQKTMILEMIDALIYEDKAVSILKSHLSIDIAFQALRNADVALTEEPFFRSLLLAIFQYSVEKLKIKARIAVLPKYARNMLGVLDETLTLEYGQVFVQYSEDMGVLESKTHILKGTVVVTKNPCMHPGDVRKLEAIDVEALHHHRDVIVFPAKGQRPHPDEMAGSDLDGDEYVVIWMKELIFPGKNEPPMKYPSGQEKLHDEPITVEDMIDFLCNFILNDNIGPLANAHLAWADQKSDGIFSDECLLLAEKYPLMLDFAKTGHTEVLQRGEKPTLYPDFMSKGPSNNTYQSKKVLGVLYRFVRNLEACIDRVDLVKYDVECNELLEYPDWRNYEENAEKHRKAYTTKFMAILKKYSINSEAEALSGFVNKDIRIAQKQNELDNIILIVKSFLMDLMKKYRYIFLNELEQEYLDESEKQEHKYRKASAWYMVTYRCNPSSVLSFAWIMGDTLAQVYNKRNTPNISPIKSSLFRNLDCFLLDNYNQVETDDEVCPCINIINNIIPEWMISCRMNLTTVCYDCFHRIISEFGMNKCCLGASLQCQCLKECSPTKLIMQFMKFFLSNVFKLGKCSKKECRGFRDFDLQTAALKAYAGLAVPRNFNLLGIDLPHESARINHNSNKEGDPIRRSITGELEDWFEEELGLVKQFFMDRTEVKDVQITIDVQNEQNYVLISSTGNDSQRWELEQLVLSSNLLAEIKSYKRSIW